MYDIVIVGGGLVGASLALALQHLPLNIAIIDATSPNHHDPRLLALHVGSCQLLKNLGVWNEFAEAACAIHQVHVSSQGKFGAVRLTRDELNLAHLGHVIPAYKINAALNKRLQHVYLDFFQATSLKKIWQHEEITHLTISDASGERNVQAKIVIAADGTHSTVREQLGIAAEKYDYQQTALVTITHLQRPHQNIAYERFTPAGTIAMLPLTEQRVATIWSASNEQIQKLVSLTDHDFLQILQKQFGYRLGKMDRVDARATFPLQQLRVTQSHPSVLLLGNALHTLHPVAAQGLNLALYEVACLAEAISHNHTMSLQDLQLALSKSQKQQAASMTLSHQLAKWVSKENVLTDFLRQCGMIGLNNAPFVKQRFIKQMLGKVGNVPRLLMDTQTLCNPAP